MRFRLSTTCVIFLVGAACGTGGAGKSAGYTTASDDEGPFGASNNTSGVFASQWVGTNGPFGVTPSGGGTTGGGTTAVTAQSCTDWCNQANPSQCVGSSSSGTKPTGVKLPTTSCSTLCASSSSSASCTSQEKAFFNCVVGAQTPCYGGSMYIVGCDSQFAAVDTCESGTGGTGGSTGAGGSYGTGASYGSGGSKGTGGAVAIGTGGYGGGAPVGSCTSSSFPSTFTACQSMGLTTCKTCQLEACATNTGTSCCTGYRTTDKLHFFPCPQTSCSSTPDCTTSAASSAMSYCGC